MCERCDEALKDFPPESRNNWTALFRAITNSHRSHVAFTENEEKQYQNSFKMIRDAQDIQDDCKSADEVRDMLRAILFYCGMFNIPRTILINEIDQVHEFVIGFRASTDIEFRKIVEENKKEKEQQDLTLSELIKVLGLEVELQDVTDKMKQTDVKINPIPIISKIHKA